MVTPQAVLALYRVLLRNANKFSNYNFKDHAKRRIIWAFRSNKGLTGDAIVAEFNKGKQQLEVVKRQAIISGLYAEEASVIQSRGK